MRSRTILCVLATALISGACQDIRQTVTIGGSPTAPGPVPGPSGEAAYPAMSYELWSARSNGTPDTLLETVSGVPHDQSASFQATYQAGKAYVFRPCADPSGIPENQRNGQEYEIVSSSLKNDSVSEKNVKVSSGKQCFNHGFRPDNSGEVFTVTRVDYGGNVSGRHTQKNVVTVRAR